MTLTYAKVRILTRKLKVGKIAKRLNIERIRLTKIINGKYPAREDEKKALAEELDLPENLVLEDVAPMFEKALPVAVPVVGEIDISGGRSKRKKKRR